MRDLLWAFPVQTTSIILIDNINHQQTEINSVKTMTQWHKIVSSFVFRKPCALSDDYFQNRAVSKWKNLILLVRKSALIDIVFKEINNTTRRLTWHGIYFILLWVTLKHFSMILSICPRTMVDRHCSFQDFDARIVAYRISLSICHSNCSLA